MLKKRYQAVFWGKSAWSLLHALIWRTCGRDVLLIDDQSISFHSGSDRWLSELEIKRLEALGAKWQIAALQNFDPYLSPASFVHRSRNLHWVSGRNGHQNLTELIRKFDCLQTSETLAAIQKSDLSREILEIQQLFLTWHHDAQKKVGAPAAVAFREYPWFVELQECIHREVHRPCTSGFSDELKQLVYSFFAATGQVLRNHFSLEEAPYIALKLISPLYEVNTRWFERELLRQLLGMGAHCKRAGVQAWQLDSGTIEAALLDSYEGVVGHETLFMYGIPQEQNSLRCRFQGKIFFAMEGNHSPPEERLIERGETQLVGLTSLDYLGADTPLVVCERDVSSQKLLVLIHQKPGGSWQHYQREASETLANYCRWHDLDVTAAERLVLHANRFWYEELSPEVFGNLSTTDLRDIKILSREEGREIKGVRYWGPLMTHKFDLLGCLAEIEKNV